MNKPSGDSNYWGRRLSGLDSPYMPRISGLIEASPALIERLCLAAALAQEAGTAILRLAQQGLDTARKQDHSLVTNADQCADGIIRRGIGDVFPFDAILSEETGHSGSMNARFRWAVDPLDGTKAFAAHMPGFCVMIGLLERDLPIMGVVYDPLGDRLYFAIRGAGAFGMLSHNADTIRLRVSGRSRPEEMPLVCSPGIPDELLQPILEETGLPLACLINSVGIKVGLLLRQCADVYFNYHDVSYWDTVAPLVLAQEAGAVASFLDGRPLIYDFSEPGFTHSGPSIITNGTRHDDIRNKILEIYKRVGRVK